MRARSGRSCPHFAHSSSLFHIRSSHPTFSPRHTDHYVCLSVLTLISPVLPTRPCSPLGYRPIRPASNVSKCLSTRGRVNMISLPGLNLAPQAADTVNAPATVVTRTKELAANTEYRFEVAFARTLTIKLQTGTAEFFGTELAPLATYTFQGTKGAVFTWHGCTLEVGGDVESDYVAEETPMLSCANLHFALESLRDGSAAGGSTEMGPRVLIVGPENSGKTSLAKTLTAYAAKCGRQPMVINLDPTEGMLSPPGSFSAAVYSSIVDIEEGWGSSPISGPSLIPVKMPLVYHYGLRDPEEGKVFKPLVTRMALAVMSRLEVDTLSKQAGFIIDSSGAISQGRNGVYENIEHIVSEFSGACDVLNCSFLPPILPLPCKPTNNYTQLSRTIPPPSSFPVAAVSLRTFIDV